MSLTKDIFEAVVAGNQAETDELVRQALEAGIPAQTVLGEGLIAAMTEVGARFECGEYFVPDMLVSARAMKAGMERLRPYLVAADVKPIGKVVIGTVKGDLHDIGKNLVAVMLQGAGFQVVDLGVDVAAERFVQAARETGADLVALSALLTTTMPWMATVVEALQKAGLHGQVKVLIGGAPITQAFADHIGADGFAPDAAVAANRAREMVGV
jgi:5-methyltetrahydrofolate--homocysteine methyltransferase